MLEVIIAPEKGTNLITNEVVSYEANINTNDPTAVLHGRLIIAYNFFNDRLFENRLPRCAITLRANHQSAGYFAKDRFQKIVDGELVSEVALNPKSFKASTESVMQTLVHEMVHLEQAYYPEIFGKATRGNYHNRAWGKLMKRVGLHPSNTGKPGGKETGQRMADYIIDGGRFQIACAELLSKGFAIDYADIWKEREGRGPNKNKAKYTCNHCGANAWGKPQSNFVCGDCLAKVMNEIGAGKFGEALINLTGMSCADSKQEAA
jgi:hypothetical protein